jgi:hypothetical protein
MKIAASKNGYVTSIKTNRNKIVNVITVNNIRFRYNPVHKTYNSIVNKSLLHTSSITIEKIVKQVQDYKDI